MRWRDRGLCVGRVEPEFFFAETVRGQVAAASVCSACPVKRECLTHALEQEIEYGVWGGSTGRQRRELRRAMPAIRWADVVDDALIRRLVQQLRQLEQEHLALPLPLAPVRRTAAFVSSGHAGEPQLPRRTSAPVNRADLLTRRGSRRS